MPQMRHSHDARTGLNTMKTYLECFPCFVSQAFRAARIATDDPEKIKQVIDEVGMMLKDIPFDTSPPETGILIYSKVREITGNQDPYSHIKAETTKKALSLYPFLKDQVEQADDRLLMAIRIAVAGNVIDFGANVEFDLEKDINEILNKDFAVFHYKEFKKLLSNTNEVLYLADNAGETVFDRVLIETMGKPVTYAVRDVPVINDATRKDAMQAGIDKVATIISSGTDGPGTILKRCNTEFRNLYNNARLVISKGQGNYEALSHENRPVFFLLKVKCNIVATDIGVNTSDIVLKAAYI